MTREEIKKGWLPSLVSELWEWIEDNHPFSFHITVTKDKGC